MAAEAGVTTVGTGPGSSNILGGTFIAVKTFGDRVDDMILKRKVAMKCAFGENPKFCYREKSVTSRMTTAAKLREELLRAKEYIQKKEAAGEDYSKIPPFNFKLESLIPVIKKEIPLKAHAHRADDIFTAIRVAKEIGVNLTLEHCTEGHLIAGYLAKEGIPLAIGPTFGHAVKFELKNKSFETPGILAKAGCDVSIITDSPVIPQQNLALCAAFAIKSGMDENDALKAVTINPAKHLGVADRVGSLEIGKDADIILASGPIFDFKTEIVQVFINGKKVISGNAKNTKK
jgi:imidazolonepropionase-like amidohydrolase